jgi:hypothetical protein
MSHFACAANIVKIFGCRHCRSRVRCAARQTEAGLARETATSFVKPGQCAQQLGLRSCRRCRKSHIGLDAVTQDIVAAALMPDELLRLMATSPQDVTHRIVEQLPSSALWHLCLPLQKRERRSGYYSAGDRPNHRSRHGHCLFAPRPNEPGRSG